MPSPSAFTFVIYFGLLIGTMSGWLWLPERRWRSAAAIILVAMFYGWQAFATRKDVELTILPLSGGHAEYLDAAGRSNDWLMDCGNTNSFGFITRPFLRAKGVNHLLRLLLTHGDLKHIGGAELLMAEFNCHDIYTSSLRFRSGAYRRIFAIAQREPYHFQALHRGDQAGPWHILHPTEADEFTQADDGALVRQGEFLCVRILLLSDLSRSGQERLLDRTHDLRADIVVSGMPTQTEPLCDALLDAIHPRMIIIADSELPATARASERLKDRLARRNAVVLYTREAGAVTISFRANECGIKTASHQYFKLKEMPELNRAMPLPSSEPGEQ